MVAAADAAPCAAMPSREGAAPRDRPLRPVGKVHRGSPRHVAVACARHAPPAEVLAHARAEGQAAGPHRCAAGLERAPAARCAPPLQKRPVFCVTRASASPTWGGRRGNTERPARVLTLLIISRARGVGSVARQSRPRGPWHTSRRAGDKLSGLESVSADSPGARGRCIAHAATRCRSDRLSAARWGLQGLWDRARAARLQLGRQGRR